MMACYGTPSLLWNILQGLYYMAGIAIAVAAFIGLGQLSLTREIAKTNAKREALKFAAERCQYFAEHTVPEHSKMALAYGRLRLNFLTSNPRWQIVNGEIVNHNFDAAAQAVQDAEVPRFMTELVSSMNCIEAFAIPFVAKVADDDIGYQETALGFCEQVKQLMPAIFYMRRKNMARYESAVRLFDRWNRRLVASAMAPFMKSLEAFIRDAGQGIPPMGADD
jgi:hypothetical protein